MVNTPVDINQVKQLAATGHFRSIALWLNYSLVPQSIYAQVQSDENPGYLQVLLEFERPPKKDVLIRLVCNRICRIDSSIIRGVHLVGRLIGTNQSLWQCRVRLAQRQPPTQRSVVKHTAQTVSMAPPSDPVTTPSPASDRSAAAQPVVAQPTLNQPMVNQTAEQSETITTATYNSKLLNTVPSYLIPREANTQERRRRPNRSVTPFPVVQIRPASIDRNQTSMQRRLNRRRFAPKETIEQQFKYMRAIIVTGSASAAFILGCVTEAVLSHRGQVARKASPTLPTFNEDSGWRSLSDVDAKEIAYRSAMRGPTVPAALEPIAVMPHKPSSSPDDPTVTLVFGGEVPVGDVPLQTPDAVEKVLGELDVFREADVAMVGLGNSLASADTSLQENYFDRTRPDASDALLKGGIDIVGLTGEQTMDFGRQGLIETLDTLDSAGIYRVGAGRNQQEARRPEVLEVKGQRIAYLSYAPDSDETATLGQAGLNIQQRDGIIEDIAALREAVDWIVVNYRWYGDLAAEPSDQQVDLSRAAIDAGADLVVGSHPEQLQGTEVYKSRPIVYSLGDFIFQDMPLENHNTATLRVSLRAKQMKVEFLPVSVREGRPQAASGETAKAILKQIRQASEGLPSPLQFPVILDAIPLKEPLLKPKKPVAPIKTLGELEPSPLNQTTELDGPVESIDYPGYVNEPVYEEFSWPENSELDVFENFAPDREGIDSNTVEQFTPKPHADESQSLEVEEWGDNTIPENVTPNGPLDSFNTQPEESEIDGTETNKAWELPPEPDDLILPSEGSGDIPDADGHSLERLPEQTIDNEMLVPDEQSLPEYDVLEDWGQKSSPHKEFNPIQERLNSLENNLESNGLEPNISVEETGSEVSEDTTEAISPHDEPLVGPLS